MNIIHVQDVNVNSHIEAEAQAFMEALAEVDITQLPWPEASMDQVMEVLQFLLRDSLTERPRRGRATQADQKNLAWCFVAGEDFQPMPVRTFSTLEKKIQSGALYFTPNTFCSRRFKRADRLRWLNAFYVDIDDPEMCLVDVLEAAAGAGLPEPSLVSKTPRGFHVFWKIKPVRATTKAVRCYTALLRAVVEEMGGDCQAATSERFMRIPRQILYFTKNEYTLQDFLDWHFCVRGEEKFEEAVKFAVRRKDILQQPAIQVLLRGVEEGRRNSTCFTLALAFKISGWSYEEALSELLNWNTKNSIPLSKKEVVRTVRSAFFGRYQGPSAAVVRRLSGEQFKYQCFTPRRPTGRPRGRPRKQENIRDKFLEMLRDAGGVLVTRESREKLAKKLGCARCILDQVVSSLMRQGLVEMRLRRLGRGRGAEVVYILRLEENGSCSANRSVLENSEHIVNVGAREVRAGSFADPSNLTDFTESVTKEEKNLEKINEKLMNFVRMRVCGFEQRKITCKDEGEKILQLKISLKQNERSPPEKT